MAAAPGAEPALAAESASEGERAHLEVPAKRWCVTRADLRELQRQVREAVRDGRLVPTAQDDFDPADSRVGPSIYTVTEQFIKPVTAEAGGVSWALMRHPEGLECDLFITHAWTEGIHEFVDKVLNSWPRGCEHAWCCMLAMPQNLDISSLISCPKGSPFAQALTCAHQVLVVPNRRRSIYSRLWCVYEAFLAQQQNKIVEVAVAPQSSIAARSVTAVLATALVVAVVAGLVAPGNSDPKKIVLDAWACTSDPPENPALDGLIAWFLVELLVVLSFVVSSLRLRLSVIVAGTMCSAYACTRHDWGFVPFVAYFVAAEFDRVTAWADSRAYRQLTQFWQGSARHATCAKQDDKSRIWAEIGNHAGDVDRAISVLIRAKMSTPLLNALARSGVEVRHAVRREWAFTIYMMSMVPRTAYLAKCQAGVLDYLSALCLVVWAILSVFLPRDRHALAMRAQQKVAMLYFLLDAMLSATATAGLIHDPLEYSRAALSVALLLSLAVSACRWDALVEVPAIGPRLVQFLIGRSLWGDAWHRSTSLADASAIHSI